MPMATKIGRMVANLEQLLPIMLIYPLVTCLREIEWKVKDIIYPLRQCLPPPDLARWWLILTGFYPKCYSSLWPWGLATSRGKLKPLYLPITVPMNTKLDRMVTNLGWLLTIMLIYPLITWFSKIPWQTKNVICPLPQWLWLLNLAGWWLTLRGSFP